MTEALNKLVVRLTGRVKLSVVASGVLSGAAIVLAVLWVASGRPSWSIWTLMPTLASLAIILLAVLARYRTS